MEDYNPSKVSHIEYLPYKEVPSSTEFNAGEKKEIVLRNKDTGKLEKISFVLSGAVPSYRADGQYLWYWGRVTPECGVDLCFFFDRKDELKISAIYAARSMDPKLYKEKFGRFNGCAAGLTALY